MPLSGYQIESVLTQFRKRFVRPNQELKRSEKLKISPEALVESERFRGFFHNPDQRGWITPEVILEIIEDRSPSDPIIEYEQQRRAGLFLEPRYIPRRQSPPIIDLVRPFLEQFRNPGGVKAQKGAGLQAQTKPEEFSQSSQELPQLQVSPEQQGLIEEDTHQMAAYQKSVAKKAPEPDIDIDEEIEEELDSSVNEPQDDMDADVVYGTGRISEEAIVRFVYGNPDSAVKYMMQKDLEGKPLSRASQELYQDWAKRGLARKKLNQFVCNLMEWDEMPKDKTVKQIYDELRDKIYELNHMMGRV